MNAEQQAAFEWAKNQNFRSVAARYAKTLAGLIESLQAQLSASQRRADAAVEDLTKLATKPITPCHSCSKTCLFPASLAPELQPATWCRDWQWRGQQEAGEGEQDE